MITKLNFAGDHRARLIRAPRAPLAWRLKNTLRPAFIAGRLAFWAARLFSRLTGIPTLTAQLSIRVLKANGAVIDYGVVGCRVITTAFVNYLVDSLQSTQADWVNFKYHDSGVGTTAENVADTGIETTDGESRATGTQTEGASANIYKSVGTINYTTTKAITEHGLFNATTAGTLMDRTVFSAINVVNGDSIEHTYQLTVNSGG
ncbi:MAG: hypothetical protein ACE5FD_10915 [Anaerolineae bacterium]